MMGLDIAKNSLFQLLAKVSTSLTTFLVAVLLAKSLGASGFGDFTKVVSLVTFFYVLSDFGLNASYLQEKEKFSFKTLLFTRSSLSFLFICVVFLFVLFLPYSSSENSGFSREVKNSILLFSLTIFFQAIIQSCSAVFQEKKKYKLLFVALLGGSMSTVFVLLQNSTSLEAGIFSIMVGSFVSSVIGLLLVATQQNILQGKIAHIKEFLARSLPLGTMMFFNLLYFRADMFVLAVYRSSFDVGIYGLSYRVFDFLLTLPLFLSNSLYPYLLDDEKNNRNSVKTAKKYLIVSFLGSIILVGVFWFASPLFILLDSDFSYAIIPFRILLVSLPVFFITSILQWTLIAKKQQKFLLYPYLVIGILNIGLNILFIPKGSYAAAAIITGVCELLIAIVLTMKILVFTKKMQNGN